MDQRRRGREDAPRARDGATASSGEQSTETRVYIRYTFWSICRGEGASHSRDIKKEGKEEGGAKDFRVYMWRGCARDGKRDDDARGR